MNLTFAGNEGAGTMALALNGGVNNKIYFAAKERSFNLLLGFGGSEEECERAKVFLGKAWEVRQEAERLREGDMTGTASVNAPFQGGGVLEG